MSLGRPGQYRLALDENFAIICAVMMTNKIVKPCESVTVKGKKNHDASAYLCHRWVISSEKLISTVEAACERFSVKSRSAFPAYYEGPEFEIKGPYFTFPIAKDGIYTKGKVSSRVVFNSKCEFVGAITSVIRNSQRKLVKCHRIGSAPVPERMPIDLTEPINERHIPI